MHLLVSSAPLVVLCAVCSVLPGQAAWTRALPLLSPAARSGITGVTDGTGMYVFGGNLVDAAGGRANDLWRHDGLTWTQVSSTGPVPPPRHWYGLSWDGLRSRLVLFGGTDDPTTATNFAVLGDTWEHDGSNWFRMAPASSPSARMQHAMAYDPFTARTILFGGTTGTPASTANHQNDTWAWDGTNWSQVVIPNPPLARSCHRLCSNPITGELLMFGGRNAASVIGDCHVFTNNAWQSITPIGTPFATGLFAHGMAFDSLRGRFVVHGGSNGTSRKRTYELPNLVAWVDRGDDPALPGRTDFAMCYVPALQRTVLFGGFTTVFRDDTWNHQTNCIPTISSFGSGCPGPSGTLALVPGNMPWGGGSGFEVLLQNAGPGSLGILVVGLSNTYWPAANAPLPQPLATLLAGTPQACLLLVSPDSSHPLLLVGGSATARLALPDLPWFANFPFHLQAAEVAPQGTGFAVTVSNGLQATIGLP